MTVYWIERKAGTRCWLLKDGHRVKTLHFATGTEPKIIGVEEGVVIIEGNIWKRGKVIRDRLVIQI